MNILPKKRWHVRTKENIARVRKDEAEAAEKERQENLRIETATREARLNILKQKSKQKLSALDIDQTDQTSEQSTSEIAEHVNLFTDIDHAVSITNKEHDNEIKQKQEEYEKKIGYLTYLGQDTNESLKKKNWYEVDPKTRSAESSSLKDTYEKLVLKDVDGKPKEREVDVRNGEYYWKSKQMHDPINKFKIYCSKDKIITNNKSIDKHVKEVNQKSKDNKSKIKVKESKEDKDKKMQKLREARLRREQQEKYKTDMFLSGLNKSKISEDISKSASPSRTNIKPKYNSQFNPEIARQNFR